MGRREINAEIFQDMTESLNKNGPVICHHLQKNNEAYEFLKAKEISIYPSGEDQFYENGLRGKLMRFLYFVMSKSKIGDLMPFSLRFEIDKNDSF